MPYYYSEFVERLFAAILKLKARGISAPAAARRLPQITQFRDELDEVLAYYDELHVSRKVFTYVCNFIISVFDTLGRDDPFSRNGRLFVLTDTEVKTLVNDMTWIQATPTIAHDVGKLIVSCNSLAYTLYTDVWPSAVGDMSHGPYQLADDASLIVRDYRDLAPDSLWPSTKKSGIKSVKVLTCYQPNTDLRIDYYGTLLSNSSLIDTLDRFAVIVDGRPASKLSIRDLWARIARLAMAQDTRFRSLGLEAQKRKFLEAHCYFERDLLHLAGISWQPTQSMYKSIAGKPLLPTSQEFSDTNTAKLVYARALKALES